MRRKAYGVSRMLEKAKKLAESNRIEYLGDKRYNVIGDHGTYMVVESPDGKISCSCPGYRNRGRCSHSIAVLIRTHKYRK